MCNKSFSWRTTTNPEKTCALRDPPFLGFALRGVLDEIADWLAGALNARTAPLPPARLIGLGESEAAWDPEQSVVVDTASLRQLEDPLPAERNARAICEAAEVPHRSADVLRSPLNVRGVRERDEDRRPVPKAAS